MLATSGSTRAQSSAPQSAYQVVLDRVALQRQTLEQRFRAADEAARAAVIAEARTYLLGAFADEIFPAWYGTTWEFYGTTQTPRQGGIACGYFVTTTLEQAGFRISRVELAKQYSENMIKNLTPAASIKRFSNAPMAEVERVLKRWGEGLYLVGLDRHTGFIVVRGGKLSFVHSSYYDDAMKVVSQPLLETSPLTDSKYRVIGKLLGDEMIRRWLLGEQFPVTFQYRPPQRNVR